MLARRYTLTPPEHKTEAWRGEIPCTTLTVGEWQDWGLIQVCPQGNIGRDSYTWAFSCLALGLKPEALPSEPSGSAPLQTSVTVA